MAKIAELGGRRVPGGGTASATASMVPLQAPSLAAFAGSLACTAPFATAFTAPRPDLMQLAAAADAAWVGDDEVKPEDAGGVRATAGAAHTNVDEAAAPRLEHSAAVLLRDQETELVGLLEQRRQLLNGGAGSDAAGALCGAALALPTMVQELPLALRRLPSGAHGGGSSGSSRSRSGKRRRDTGSEAPVKRTAAVRQRRGPLFEPAQARRARRCISPSSVKTL